MDGLGGPGEFPHVHPGRWAGRRSHRQGTWARALFGGVGIYAGRLVLWPSSLTTPLYSKVDGHQRPDFEKSGMKPVPGVYGAEERGEVMKLLPGPPGRTLGWLERPRPCAPPGRSGGQEREEKKSIAVARRKKEKRKIKRIRGYLRRGPTFGPSQDRSRDGALPRLFRTSRVDGWSSSPTDHAVCGSLLRLETRGSDRVLASPPRGGTVDGVDRTSVTIRLVSISSWAGGRCHA